MDKSTTFTDPLAGKFLRHDLPYTEDSARYFEAVRHAPWAMLLDSGQPVSQYGRFDIVVARPFTTLTTQHIDHEMVTTVTSLASADDSDYRTTADPFYLLNDLMQPYIALKHALDVPSTLPFMGGAMGYFGYDLARSVETLPITAISNPAIPAMMIGLYDWALVVDHRAKTATLVSYGLHQSTHDDWQQLCADFECVMLQSNQTQDSQAHSVCEFALSSDVQSNMTYAEYTHAFEQVKHFISEGDCYQVNLAQRFAANAQGDAWHAYQQLKKVSPAPFMAFMNFANLQVLSGSPERFLQISEQHVETRPIKGTRPRSDDPVADLAFAKELQTSLKDRAENVMIVDLLRNDIGKNCVTGSVKAEQLFQLQSFANVHHLVSIVTGTLDRKKTALDLLRGAFPGGSITGAPKLRAMQIIETLEPHQRAIYCGAIGYIDFNGNMDTNIAIRTIVYVKPSQSQAGEVSFYAGGGIVADSVLEKEYAETLDKASSMLKTMQFFKQSASI